MLDTVELPPTITDKTLVNAQSACVVAIVIIGICLLLLYRVSALALIVTVLGETAFMFALITGYFPDSSGILLSKAGIAGTATILAAGVFSALAISQKYKEASKTDGGLSAKNVHQANVNGRRFGITVNLSLLFISVCMMGAFGPVTSSLHTFMNVFLFWTKTGYNSVLYQFAQMVFLGSIINLFFEEVIYPSMLWSLSQFEHLKDAKFWGGNR